MKKHAVFALGLAMVATTVVAQPALAEGPEDCVESIRLVPELTSVYRDENGDIKINPGAVPDDVMAQADRAVAWALYLVPCLEGGIVTGPTRCYVDKAVEIAGSMDPLNFYLRYVSYDGTEFTVHTSTLFADVGAC